VALSISSHVHRIVAPQSADRLAQALQQTHGRYATYWNAVLSAHLFLQSARPVSPRNSSCLATSPLAKALHRTNRFRDPSGQSGSTYSYRIALTGSRPAARRAGSQHANTPTSASANAT
jgi:hypothetical protein